MRLKLWPIVAFLVLLGALGAIRGEAADGAETSLADVAKVSGCKGEPAGYVSGYFSSDDRLSGVFWCTRDPDAESDRFLIVVVNRHPPSALRCPSVLRSVNWPQQLKILRDARIPLSWFVVRDKPSNKGPAGQYSTGPVIDTGSDGAGEQWFCHNGAWLVRVYH